MPGRIVCLFVFPLLLLLPRGSGRGEGANCGDCCNSLPRVPFLILTFVAAVYRDLSVMDELARAQGRWRRKINGEAFPVLERWLKKASRYCNIPLYFRCCLVIRRLVCFVSIHETSVRINSLLLHTYTVRVAYWPIRLCTAVLYLKRYVCFILVVLFAQGWRHQGRLHPPRAPAAAVQELGGR